MAALPVCLVGTLQVFTWALYLLLCCRVVSVSDPFNPRPHLSKPAGSHINALLVVSQMAAGRTLSDRVGPRRLMLVLTPLLAGSTALMGVSNWSGRQAVGSISSSPAVCY
ncbi:hypothetical protein Hamer_G026786 [Homarus americanus]|uniref:Uncharacterized protein n=1 Tax=Homarus americanus TaxID=6706 RepID=A0A8J5N340_HOMAM|nr:hypothetical protein Hamer_G026786 [Homarus americanus]